MSRPWPAKPSSQRPPSSPIRREALAFLGARFGTATYPYFTSRYFPKEKSMTRSPGWWIEIPVDLVDDPSTEAIDLLCRTEDESSFYHLRVPAWFLREHLDQFERGVLGGKLILHLSALEEHRFADYWRHRAGVDFSRWVQT